MLEIPSCPPRLLPATPPPTQRAGAIKPALFLRVTIVLIAATGPGARDAMADWQKNLICGGGYGGGCGVAPPPRHPPFVNPQPRDSDPEQLQFEQQLAAFRDLINRILPSMPPDWGGWLQVSPVSPQDMADRLDRIGGMLDSAIADAWTRLFDDRTRLAADTAGLRDLPLELVQLSAKLRELRAEVQSDRNEARLSEDGARQYTEQSNTLAEAARTFLADTARSKESAAEWLWVAAPAELRTIGPDAARDSPAATLAVDPQRTIPAAAATAAPATAARPAPAAPPPYPSALPAVVGDNGQKMAAVGSLASTLQSLNSEAAEAENAAALLAPRVDALAGKRDTLLSQVEGAHSAVREAADALHAANGRLLAAQQALGKAGDTFVLRAAEAYVWRIFKDYVVKPEARRFIAENAGLLARARIDPMSDDEVHAICAKGESMLGDMSGRIRGMQRFVAVQNQTLDLLRNAEHLLQQAPSIIAYAPPREAEAFEGEIGDVTARAGAGFIDAGGHGGAVNATGFIDRRLPSPMRYVAEKLKLADPEQ